MADKRTDQLPDADPLDGSELIAVVQDGNSRKATTGDVAGMPHDHAIDDVAGLATALAGKADAEHDHAIADVTGLAAALAAVSSLAESWTPNFSGTADVLIYAEEAMTVEQQAIIGTGEIAYAKSTAALPSTFAITTLPTALEAGAWLKISASGVIAPFAVHLKRSA